MKNWEVYKSTWHTKGMWAFGFSKSPSGFTLEFYKWSWTIYKDEF